MAGHNMVLLHGFVKKTQKTSAQDLELALRRAKSFEEASETKTSSFD